MISKDELITQLTGSTGKKKVLELSRIIKEHAFALRDLIDLTFYADKGIAFRAAWILENLFLQKPELYLTDLNYLMAKFKDVQYPSCKRHYAKILMHITDKKALFSIKQKLQEFDLEPVVEKCFDWMIDPKVRVAVKVFAADALFNLKDRYPWIKEELGNEVQFLMKNGTAAMQSHGKKILSLLADSR
jgi:hypothetical protein